MQAASRRQAAPVARVHAPRVQLGAAGLCRTSRVPRPARLLRPSTRATRPRRHRTKRLRTARASVEALLPHHPCRLTPFWACCCISVSVRHHGSSFEQTLLHGHRFIARDTLPSGLRVQPSLEHAAGLVRQRPGEIKRRFALQECRAVIFAHLWRVHDVRCRGRWLSAMLRECGYAPARSFRAGGPFAVFASQTLDSQF
jgi:hypothetical protein